MLKLYQMTSCKSESIVLIPMLEREVTERSCVGKFQVGKMPIDNLETKIGHFVKLEQLKVK